jgi:phosphopantothenoylcysteine decarboxylase/phosphopantothenate--cysteine ligase
MWSNPATVENVRILKSRGMQVMEPEVGALTSGDSGKGRFPGTSSILEAFQNSTLSGDDLRGKSVLVTAGGTREAIDPVRYIGNHSSGKQGVAIAEAALHRGAQVTLIAANVNEEIDSKINIVRVESADEMLIELEKFYRNTDFLFMSAAVADAKVSNKASEKIKKSNLTSLELVENPDLLLTLSKRKDKQIIVAFAAETEVTDDLEEAHNQARLKMIRKGADFIYLNDVSHGEIFGSDETCGWLIGARDAEEVPKTTKKKLANLLINNALKSARQLP